MIFNAFTKANSGQISSAQRVAQEHQAADAVFCKEAFGSKELFAHLQQKDYAAIELCGGVVLSGLQARADAVW